MHACAGPAVASHAFPALWGTYGDFWPILSIGYARIFFIFRSDPRPGALFLWGFSNTTTWSLVEPEKFLGVTGASVRRDLRVFGTICSWAPVSDVAIGAGNRLFGI